MGIFSQSKYKNEAWEFIKFLFSPQAQLELYTQAEAAQDTYLPPNIEAWRSLPMDEGFKNVLRKQALDAKGPPSVLNWDENTRFIDEAIQRVILQGADPKKELSKVVKEINSALQK